MKKFKFLVPFLSLFLLFPLFACDSPSPNEEYVTSIVRNYRSILKDPASMTLYDSVYYYKKNDDVYVFFDASAKNSYGGTVKKGIMYKNGSYVGTYEDDGDSVGYTAVYYLKTKYYNEYTEKIDGKKVADKIGCGYMTT